jgi:hypothetical protein
MKRRRNILLLVIVVAVAAAALFFVLLPHGGSRRRVEALKELLRKHGEKLTMEELAPYVSSNGVSAGRAFTNAMNGYALPSNYPSPIKLIAPGIGMMGHSNIEPGQMEGYSSNLAGAAELRSILNSERLEFDLDYSLGVRTPFPHLSKLKHAAQLFSITALQALHETNQIEAWSDVTASAELLRRYRGEPLWMPELVRFSMGMITVAMTWDILQEDCWSETQLAELQKCWEPVNFTNQLEATVRMERAFVISALDEARREGFNQLTLSAILPASSANDDGQANALRENITGIRHRLAYWKWRYGSSYDDERFNIFLAVEALGSASTINQSGAFFPALRDLAQEATNLTRLSLEEKSGPSAFRYPEDYYGSYFEKSANAEALRRLLVISIALKRYHLQQNSYPESLSVLIPAFLEAVPKDPWDGRPLRYRAQPDGHFTLYSIGKNGIDEGGDAAREDGVSSSSWFLGKDIVWPRLATQAEVEKYRGGRSKTNNAAEK